MFKNVNVSVLENVVSSTIGECLLPHAVLSQECNNMVRQYIALKDSCVKGNAFQH